MNYIRKVDAIENIFGDSIASVGLWDFSRANMNDDARVEAITTVASICYNNPNIIGKSSLYDRLARESAGLPSSSFEFVPVLLSGYQYGLILRMYDNVGNPEQLNVYKYGEFLSATDNDGEDYLLTNYRALLNDYQLISAGGGEIEDFTKWFNNTDREVAVIKEHFPVFLSNLDLPTRSQYIRHRVSWQELSRRYVSGKKLPFTFYISEDMDGIYSKHEIHDGGGYGQTVDLTTQLIVDMAVTHYNEAIKRGVKPQNARRILPQAAYSTLWSAWTPQTIDGFFKLRLDSHAQWEIRQLAKAKLHLMHENGFKLMKDYPID